MLDNYKLRLLSQIENLLGESIEYVESDIRKNLYDGIEKRIRENFIIKAKDTLNKYRDY